MFAIKNREKLENFEELVSLKIEVKELHLREKFGKHNFHENVKELQEPLINAIKNTSENLTKTFMETYVNNNKTKEN